VRRYNPVSKAMAQLSSKVIDAFRLLGAALFVIAGLSGLIAFFGWLVPDGPSGILVPVFLLALVAVFISAMLVFRGKFPGRRRVEERADARRLQLEQTGLLVPEYHRATRAFQVEEVEDEGSHYYIELDDGSVLFLSGQYLYEYEPRFRGKQLERARRFPCTEFTFRRHKLLGYIVDIQCTGSVLEPEAIAAPFSQPDFDKDLYPQDDSILRNKTYDQLKA